MVSFGTGLTSDGRGKTLGVSDAFPINGNADNLWLSLTLAETTMKNSTIALIDSKLFSKAATPTRLPRSTAASSRIRAPSTV